MIDLCLTLAERSPTNLERKIAQYNGEAHYIEVRLDYLGELTVPSVPSGSETEFIATCRPAREGGRYQGEERDRLELLQKAAHSGFSWLDLEQDVQGGLSLPSSTRIVRSYHCFDHFPQDLSSRFQSLREAGGDVIKLALCVRNTKELVSLLSWMESLPGSVPVVILGMGDLGQPSRLLGGFLGNFWTYVAESEKERVVPGQFTLKEAIEWYRLPTWKSRPFIYGVLGNPVAHSLSPVIHNHLFQHYGLEKIYLPFPLDDIDVWFEYINKSPLSFHGFSVTLPFKTDVLKFVRVKNSPVDSLNTLMKKGSWWEGLNTDYQGFLQALKSCFSLKERSAVVLGNGGVAHTVVKALQDEGTEVTVVGRDPKRVARFAKRYGCRHALFSDLPMAADICVNATPVGQYPNVADSPLQEHELDFELIYDLVYHPEQTQLLQLANRRGLKTVSGMEMFVEQAALQFTAWTGFSPDRNLMKEMIRELTADN